MRICKNIISDIHSRGKKAVLVGGTGLYYSSLVDNVEFLPEDTDFEYREMLKSRAEKEGAQVLLDELAAVDPEAASRLHPNNLGRIIRALEIYRTTGKTITEQNELSRSNETPFKTVSFCLDARDRQFLYDRINRRVDIMLESGLEAEARAFLRIRSAGPQGRQLAIKSFIPISQGRNRLRSASKI